MGGVAEFKDDSWSDIFSRTVAGKVKNVFSDNDVALKIHDTYFDSKSCGQHPILLKEPQLHHHSPEKDIRFKVQLSNYIPDPWVEIS